jgi:hypothetical protein
MGSGSSGFPADPATRPCDLDRHPLRLSAERTSSVRYCSVKARSALLGSSLAKKHWIDLLGNLVAVFLGEIHAWLSVGDACETIKYQGAFGSGYIGSDVVGLLTLDC